MGNYWTVLPHGIGQDYSNMHFFDNDSGFILTWGGDIQKTNNGGMSWILDTINTSIGFTPFPGIGSIQFVNDTTGIIGAGIYGTYARTFDRGLNWQKGSIDSNMNIVSIYMRNQWRGYAVGFDGKYSQTFDGGATWTVPVILSQYRLNDIAFFSDSVGYIVGGNFIPQITGSSKGIILKTIDAGNSWFVEDTSLPGWLTSIVAINNSAGYAVGWNGQILKTVNGAATGLTPDAQLSNNFIYPNPTRDFLNINYRNDILENSIFILYDVTGREVEKLPCSSQCSVNLSGYEQGLYFYEIVKSGKRKLTGKVSKIN